MPLVSVPCPACHASTYLSLPDGHRFVTAEPGEGDDGRDDLTDETLTCEACGTEFPVRYGPARD
ncbi:Trm112 family protein [Halogeometricum limi]|uniref:Uncharacterized protein n=1 Tax=Halogeometricum limi TaxID=555875 RepID=A0A1I6GNH4_9EURY|nr:Trm112 family protein [Halogeometricum limi]SFR43607.1 hypothetical protein SAMN04488124_1298 [Halogeometricum limi]